MVAHTHGAADPVSLLAAGLAALQLNLSAPAQSTLLAYLALLGKWNRVYNLTAIDDPRKMITHHLLDSLAVVPHVQGPRVLDVGSGAGLPGIPLAVALPAVHFVLLDRTAKKTRFITQAVGELSLANVEVVTDRVEGYHPVELFDTVVSRAFSSLADFVAAAAPLLNRTGRLLALKGLYPADELAALPSAFQAETSRLNVPGLNEERHVVCLRPRSI